MCVLTRTPAVPTPRSPCAVRTATESAAKTRPAAHRTAETVVDFSNNHQLFNYFITTSQSSMVYKICKFFRISQTFFADSRHSR